MVAGRPLTASEQPDVRVWWDALSDGCLVCTPEAVTLGQVVRVVFKYVTDHPELLHEDKYELVRDALIQVWACKPG